VAQWLTEARPAVESDGLGGCTTNEGSGEDGNLENLGEHFGKKVDSRGIKLQVVENI
jgi:hypothetical protein